MQAIKLVKEQDMDLAVDMVARHQSAQRRKAQEAAEITAEMLDELREDVRHELIDKAAEVLWYVFGAATAIGLAAYIAHALVGWFCG